MQVLRVAGFFQVSKLDRLSVTPVIVLFFVMLEKVDTITGVTKNYLVFKPGKLLATQKTGILQLLHFKMNFEFDIYQILIFFCKIFSIIICIQSIPIPVAEFSTQSLTFHRLCYGNSSL